jgi:DinB superfamily/Mycothiol maleylpyruvate isomerase N-terminal domain
MTTNTVGRGAGSVRLADLGDARLSDIRSRDLRAPERDLWADEAAIWSRLTRTWAGLDDAAWHLPGAAPSDAGGAPWSLAEHVGHIADWQELAHVYTARAIETGVWPSDTDYDEGDFDTYNERRREPWASMPRDATLARFYAARPRLLDLAHRLTPETIREDEPWGWVYNTLHGHYLDHLAVIEPWTDDLRRRQVDGDPFVADPRPADHAAFLAQEAAIAADFDALIRAIPADRWTTPDLTPGWDLADHVGHLADWAEEGTRAVAIFERGGSWPADPEEGIDAWNERMVARSRGATVEAILARHDAARAGLLEAVGRLSIEDLRSPDGWSWAYDCLHGHTRKHLAMLGPWCAAIARPAGPS